MEREHAEKRGSEPSQAPPTKAPPTKAPPLDLFGLYIPRPPGGLESERAESRGAQSQRAPALRTSHWLRLGAGAGPGVRLALGAGVAADGAAGHGGLDSADPGLRAAAAAGTGGPGGDGAEGAGSVAPAEGRRHLGPGPHELPGCGCIPPPGPPLRGTDPRASRRACPLLRAGATAATHIPRGICSGPAVVAGGRGWLSEGGTRTEALGSSRMGRGQKKGRAGLCSLWGHLPTWKPLFIRPLGGTWDHVVADPARFSSPKQ